MRAQESVRKDSIQYIKDAKWIGDMADPLPKPKTDVLYVLPYGGMWLQDSYLSPLVYDGWMAGIGNEWRGYLDKGGLFGEWRYMGNLQVYGGKIVQSQKKNTISHLDVQGGWGSYYRWRIYTGESKGIDASRVHLWAGPYIGVDVMMKELARNVNKPYSFDMGADLQLMAGVSYTFYYKETAYRLLYEGRMNVMGAMWLPDYWQSYYETSEKVNLGGSVAFSYPGNRQFIHQQLAMDFQFRKSTWRLGMMHEYLHYGDKNRHFARQSVGLTVGCIFNYKLTRTGL